MAHILMKFGGGLITTKSKMKTVDEESIEKLSKMVFDLNSLGHKVTIAVSYTHLRAHET